MVVTRINISIPPPLRPSSPPRNLGLRSRRAVAMTRFSGVVQELGLPRRGLWSSFVLNNFQSFLVDIEVGVLGAAGPSPDRSVDASWMV